MMRSFAPCVALVVLACGSPPSSLVPDGGTNVADPTPPGPVAPPQFGTCPPGWRPSALDGTSYCEPWATDSAPTCADAELALPGVGCDPIDTCPSDGWPADLPATSVVYVRAGATGGDGTRAAPLASVQDAARITPIGGTIAVAVGVYDGPVRAIGITLRGACAARTQIRNPSNDPYAYAVAVASGGVVRGLRLTGGNFGLLVEANATASGSELWLEAPYGALNLDPRSRFEGERIRVDGLFVSTDSTEVQWAIGVRIGASLTLRHSSGSSLGRYFASGIQFIGETLEPMSLTFEDGAATDAPLMFVAFTNVTLRRSAVERTSLAVSAQSRSLATLEDVVIRDVVVEGGVAGTGLAAAGGRIVASRVLGQRIAGPLLASENRPVDGALGAVEATDLVVSTSTGETLFFADRGSTMSVSRVHAIDVASNAFFAEAGGAITGRDVRVSLLARDGVVVGDLADARGAAHIELSNVDAHVARVLALASSGASIVLNDVTSTGGIGAVAQCVPEDDRRCDDGMPSSIVLHRAYLHDLARAGLGVLDARGEMVDVDIDGVASVNGVSDALSIHGLLTAERVRIRHATSRAVLLFGEGTDATIRDLQIDGIAGADCAGGACINGDGLTCALGASGRVDRLDVRGASRAGLALVDDCLHLAITDARVTHNEIGALTDTGGATGVTLERVEVSENVNDYNTVELVVTAPVLDL